MPKIFIADNGLIFTLAPCDNNCDMRTACAGCYFNMYKCVDARMQLFRKQKYPMCHGMLVFKLVSGI